MNVESKKAALAQVTRRIQCVRNQLRRRQCLEISSSWPEHILKTSILIFHLSEVACAAEFLLRHCYGSSLEAAERLFVDMFQQTPTEEIVKISFFAANACLSVCWEVCYTAPAVEVREAAEYMSWSSSIPKGTHC